MAMQSDRSPRKGILNGIGFLPLFLAFFCLASCSSARREEGAAPLPAQEAADEGETFLPEEADAPDEGILEMKEELEEAAAEKPIRAEPEPPKEEEAKPLEPAAKTVMPEEDDNEVVAVVDDVVITRQEHLQTKSEVEAIVDDLNQITRQKDYNRWLAYLAPSYREMLSNRTYLEQISNSLPRALRDRRVRLTTLRDYFDYVFVPSRQNIRVDDIQYITPTRVYVIMDLSGNQRAAVYILEKENGGSWKLTDKNQ